MYNLYVFDDEVKNGIFIKSIVDEFMRETGLFKNLLLDCINADFIQYVENLIYEKDKTNIYIVDISLGAEIDGLNLAKMIRNKDIYGYIIFCTSHLEWVVMSYNYNVKAINYIYKLDPNFKRNFFATFEQIHKESNQRFDKTEDTPDYFLQYSYNGNHYKLKIDDIVYIETNTLKRCLNIHYRDDVYEYPKTMKNILNELPVFFIKCHKSFILNTRLIESVIQNESGYIASFINQKKCYISKKYLGDVIHEFNRGRNR